VSLPLAISLFSGAGGLDYGIEAAGFGVAVATDVDHDSCETLRQSGSRPVIERDVFDVPTDELLEASEASGPVGTEGHPSAPRSEPGVQISRTGLPRTDRSHG
jgi:DNA (cytosine-5)-methyltransferase 1